MQDNVTIAQICPMAWSHGMKKFKQADHAGLNCGNGFGYFSLTCKAVVLF